MAMNERAARRSCLSAGRGAVLAIHAAAGIATECDLQATRLFRAAEGICRAAVARLEQCGRISATPPSGHAAAASSPQERAAGTSGHAAAAARTCSEVHEPQKATSNKSKKKPKKQQNETADMDIVMLPIPAPSPHATVGQLTDSAEANGSLLVGDLAEFGQGSGAASVGPSSSRASGVAAIAATIKHDVNMGKEQGSTAASVPARVGQAVARAGASSVVFCRWVRRCSSCMASTRAALGPSRASGRHASSSTPMAPMQASALSRRQRSTSAERVAFVVADPMLWCMQHIVVDCPVPMAEEQRAGRHLEKPDDTFYFVGADTST